MCVGLTVTACGDDDGGPAGGSDATVVFIDAPLPDAPTPDAFVCNMTDCGNNQCVDLDTDPFHCGMCDRSCNDGQTCVSGDCVCPTVTAPATPTPIFVQVDSMTVPGATFAIGVFSAGAGADGLVLFYDPVNQVTDMDLDISMLSGLTPSVLYGYNVDIGSMQFQTAYIATAGTLNFDYACATGASATMTDVTFSQVTSIMDPTPLPGGCEFTAPSITIALGDNCPSSGADAGVTDAAPSP